ncbi:MAG: purine-nucleoside phosphorylase [Thermoanaerobacteraceae bacterium]|nr:purine-nucleoside phosphorylase [Thermoanaerobacteraceae bacterium]
MKLEDKLNETVSFLAAVEKNKPRIGLILGSGLGVLAEEIANAKKYAYEDIPHFPVSTVEGHAGQLVCGDLGGKTVIAMQGRFHYYEGYSLTEVTYPVRVMRELGIETLIITNAAGGINPEFKAGDLMLIADHINLMGANPLRGPNVDRQGPRFPDMTEAYAPELRELARQIAGELGYSLQEGVYVAVFGPSYETSAEIRFLRTIGADAVGMSTVPEVIVARHAGIKVLGISCITNMAAGLGHKPLSHDEVMETAEKTKSKFSKLVHEVVRRI